MNKKLNKKLKFLGVMFKRENYNIGNFALHVFECNNFRSEQKALKFLLSGNRRIFNWENSSWDE